MPGPRPMSRTQPSYSYSEDEIPSAQAFTDSGSPYPSSLQRPVAPGALGASPVDRTSGTRGAYMSVHNQDPEMRSVQDSYNDRGYYTGTPASDQEFIGGYGRAAQNGNVSRGGRKKFWIIGAVAVAVVLIIVGVVLGVTLSKTNGNSKNNSSGGSGSTSDGSDPSKFTKNPALKNSFYGFAYTPVGSLLPDCGANLDDVIKDVQLLSQMTTRIRTYGADCNVTSLVLNAIKQTKVDLSVYLGMYILVSDDSVYERQKQETLSAIQTYGADHVLGITVGNEVILNNLTALNSKDASSAAGIAIADFLKTKVDDMRSAISGLNLKQNLQVGYADAGSFFNSEILSAVDYAMANVHPWFAVGIDQAASWTANFFQTTNVDAAANLTNHPTFSIAETGWPTNSSTAADMSNVGNSQASVANLQKFMDTFVCQANQNKTEYYFFEFKDEPWKTTMYGGVEGYWGVLDANLNLKDGLTLPDCSHD